MSVCTETITGEEAMRYPKTQEQIRAPKSLFRVIAVDVEETSGTFLLGDFDSLDAAAHAATERARVGSPVYIYDDRGKVLERLGSWH
jgi:hypothetical protein